MKRNRIVFAAFLICTMLAGCTFHTNSQEILSSQTGDLEAVTESGESISDVTEQNTETPAAESVPFAVQSEQVITVQQHQVIVTTPDEFLAAIAPNTEIIVNAELIDLSTASGYGETDGEYYYWAQTYDGPELYITEVSNLTIRGNGEDHNANIISSVPRYSNVLNFFNCSRLMVKGLTVGHTEEEGYCTGGVLFFVNCQDILVEDCGLFGCGTVGVRAEYSKDIQIINNDIYDCSYGGIDLLCCDDVNADGNTFRNLELFTFRVYDCGSVTCNGEPVFDSYHGR